MIIHLQYNKLFCHIDGYKVKYVKNYYKSASRRETAALAHLKELFDVLLL